MKSFYLALKIVLLLGAGALVVFGGIQIYQETRYHQPVEISYDDFVRKKPTAGWFHITNCVLNVSRAVSADPKNPMNLVLHGDDFTESYVPVQSAAARREEKYRPAVSLVILTGDNDLLDTFSQFSRTVRLPRRAKRLQKEPDTYLFGHKFAGFDPNDTRAAFGRGNMVGFGMSDRDEFIRKNKQRLYLKRDVEGMIRSGLSALPSAHTRLLKQRIAPIEDDFVTLEEGRTPSPTLGIKILALGLILLICQIALYISWRGR